MPARKRRLVKRGGVSQQPLATPAASAPAPAVYNPPFNANWVLLTLVLCEKLLGLGGNFRSPNAKRVALYRDMMFRGSWIWPLSPILVSSLDTLDDKQHTLLAAKEYLEAGGEPQWVELRTDVPPEWADLLDSAQVRTNSQRVQHAKFSQAGDMSSVALALWQMAMEGQIGHLTSPPTSCVGCWEPRRLPVLAPTSSMRASSWPTASNAALRRASPVAVSQSPPWGLLWR